MFAVARLRPVLLAAIVASYVAARISWQLWERRWLERKSRFDYEAAVTERRDEQT